MFGLDESIAASSGGASIWIVIAVAVLLGLRHATDPDHLAAMTTLVASGPERAARRAGELGLAWGLGHAATLFAFGFPILFLDSFLPRAGSAGGGDGDRARHRLPRPAAPRPLAPRWARFHAHPQFMAFIVAEAALATRAAARRGHAAEASTRPASPRSTRQTTRPLRATSTTTWDARIAGVHASRPICG